MFSTNQIGGSHLFIEPQKPAVMLISLFTGTLSARQHNESLQFAIDPGSYFKSTWMSVICKIFNLGLLIKFKFK